MSLCNAYIAKTDKEPVKSSEESTSLLPTSNEVDTNASNTAKTKRGTKQSDNTTSVSQVLYLHTNLD